MSRENFTKQQVLDEIRAVAKRLGRAPFLAEFEKECDITGAQVNHRFGAWNAAVKLAGLQPFEKLKKIDDETLLRDWGNVAAKIGKLPTGNEYDVHGRYGQATCFKRFGRWSQMPGEFGARLGREKEFKPVLDLIATTRVRVVHPRPPKTSVSLPIASMEGPICKCKHPFLKGRTIYGDDIDLRGLRHAPVNEQGVVFLFGMIARDLGYIVESIQPGFPDCEAKRRVAVDAWQRVRIEFEFTSRNFKEHNHPIDGCDVIVCWRDNWTDRPANLEVLELCSVIRTVGK